MNIKKLYWGVLTLIAFIVLLLAAFLLPPIPKANARASRIQAVNHVASVSVATPIQNDALKPATPNK